MRLLSTKQGIEHKNSKMYILYQHLILVYWFFISEWSNSPQYWQATHYWAPVKFAGTAFTALRVLPILGIENILNRPELVFPMASPEDVPLELSFISFKPDIDWVCWSGPFDCPRKKKKNQHSVQRNSVSTGQTMACDTTYLLSSIRGWRQLGFTGRSRRQRQRLLTFKHQGRSKQYRTEQLSITWWMFSRLPLVMVSQELAQGLAQRKSMAKPNQKKKQVCVNKEKIQIKWSAYWRRFMLYWTLEVFCAPGTEHAELQLL